MKYNINIKKLKKIGIITGSIILGLYILFLVSPVVLSPIASSYTTKLEDYVKTSTGFDINIKGLGVVTSPKLAIGLKAKKITLSIPSDEEPFFDADNFKIKLSILPLIIKKVQLDDISAKKIDSELVVKKDGTFQIEDYLVKNTKESVPMTALPYGLKLSNHLPNIHIKQYKFSFIDAMDRKSYYIQGKKFKMTDFVLDKKIKLSTIGKIVLDDSKVSDFDVKIYNKIMPNVQLDDLIFPKKVVVAEETSAKVQQLPVNIIEIFKSVYKNKLNADIVANVKTSGTVKNPKIKGKLNVSGMSVAVNGKKLPESYLNLKFKGNKTDIDSIFFTSSDEGEKTQIIGDINSGHKPSVDLTLRSNAKFNNIIRLIDSIAQSFGMNDYKTLSATGGIDADFNINSDMKKVSSTGYLKIKPSSVTYGLYNIVIDKITADIDFMNNNINIKKAGFSIFGHALKLSGTIKSDSDTDLKLTADRLALKGILAAIGQVKLLKENTFNGGTLSLNTSIKGKLSELKPDIKASIDALDVLNKATKTKLILSNALIKLLYDKKTITGNIDINSLILKNPSATVTLPQTKIVMDSKDINIKDSYLLLNNSRIDIKGVVEDYLTDKLNANITATGNILSADIAQMIPSNVRSLFPYSGKLPIAVVLKGDSKVQDVCLKITADNSNYIKLADINLLKGKTTKIHSDIKIEGDSLSFENSGIYANSKPIATVSGGASNLSLSPKLDISIDVPKLVSFPIWGMNNSNITAMGNLVISGNLQKPKVKGKVSAPDISVKDMDFVLSDLDADINGEFLNGKATAKKFKFGGIVADNLSSDFSLVNYNNFYLSNLNANAFDGKVKGQVSYGINDFTTGLDLTGSGLDSTKAVYGAVGIKNALTGTMGFDTKLTMKGVTDKEIIESMKGDVNFNVDDGRFVSIGKFENLVAAQNIASNSILKAAIASLSTLATIQETDRFKSITGSMSLSDGAANISNIKVSGPLMSYYVHGTYYIMPNGATLIILGRIDSKVVSCLGILGEFSAEKLLSYIPKFGSMTAKMLKQLTSNPADENTSLIPALSSGSTSYKDFKVTFNGPVENSSSVRSFKWLSTCDTTSIDVKKEFQNAKDAVKTNITNNINGAKNTANNIKNNVNTIVNNQKNKVQTAKQDFAQTKIDIQNARANAKESSENLKNLFQKAVVKSQTKVPSTQTQSTTTSE